MEHWEFPANDADEDEGLANAGIEFFRDAPYSGIARECGQNSLDAAQVDPASGENVPVVLSFHRHEVPLSQIPGSSELTKAMHACFQRAQARKEDKELEFFDRALKLLKEQKIDVLQIADAGTRGLRGPSQQGKPFHALVKASGVSEKSDKSAGGSFGIGKNAAYAITALRTVFYSTWYRDEGDDVFLCQGKAILASHVDENGKPRRAAGYWGGVGYQPLQSASGLPAWLCRDEQGTTVSCIGFNGEDTWRYQVAESLLRNFFAAIHRGRIVFEIDGRLTLNMESIRELFEHPKIVASSEAHGYGEDLRFARALHECLTSQDALELEHAFEGLGTMRLRLLVRDGLPKRIALLRNGMYITDSLQHFGDRLARFALQRDFVAIIEPVNIEASRIIRELENPRHDELSPERIENPSLQRKVKSAFKEFIKWLRNYIKEQTTTATEDQILLDELNQFFSPPDSKDQISDSDGKELDPNRIKIERLKPKKQRSSTAGIEGNAGGRGGENSNNSNGGRSGGSGSGAGKGGRGVQGGQTIRIMDFRNVLMGMARTRRIYFTPTVSARVRLYIEAPGVTSPERLRIKSFNGVPANAEFVNVQLAEGQRFSADIEFYIDYDGPVEVGMTVVEGEPNEAQ